MIASPAVILMRGLVTQVSISSGGMPKRAVGRANVTFDGIEGDWQRNRKYHGGRDRAVCLYSEELYDWLRTQGVDLVAGAIGENLTLRGIDLLSLSAGDRFRAGTCTLQLTSVRVPCRNLNMWHPELLRIIAGHTGWLARILEPGVIQPGDEIAPLPPEAPAIETEGLFGQRA